eukprot:1028101-Rhodomonas_salina.4
MRSQIVWRGVSGAVRVHVFSAARVAAQPGTVCMLSQTAFYQHTTPDTEETTDPVCLIDVDMKDGAIRSTWSRCHPQTA